MGISSVSKSEKTEKEKKYFNMIWDIENECASGFPKIVANGHHTGTISLRNRFINFECVNDEL